MNVETYADALSYPVKVKSTSGQVAHTARPYPSFSSLDGMLVHHRVTPQYLFAGTHLYTWVERGTIRVKCLSQEHNTVTPVRA